MKLMRIYFYLALLCSLLSVTLLKGQTSSVFFPSYQPYASNPIIKYGDGFADAAWNDPCVLKQNGQYVMYITAAVGLSGTTPVKVYRQVSTDGYNWTLSPTTPVLEPVSSTYYAGGTETPSVIYKDSTFHMYLTCYPPGNVASDFVLAHATSTNGINWTMDSAPILESDGSNTIYGSLVGEPGAVVYHDSIYVFFTSSGVLNTAPINCIGLMKSVDGTNFTTPQVAVQMPQSVYPVSSNYWGLSTPSALAINDTLYLFTDVAQTINNVWTQVALHQFKTDGISGIWNFDDAPIHTMQDFNWTNGTFYSEIRSITPLMDDNGKLRIWYAGNRLADVSLAGDTTYHVTVDGLGNLHVDPNYWGIGTSEYQYSIPTSIKNISSNQILMYPNPTNGIVYINKNLNIQVYDVLGSMIINKKATSSIDLSILSDGLYFINIIDDNKKLIERKKIIKE